VEGVGCGERGRVEPHQQPTTQESLFGLGAVDLLQLADQLHVQLIAKNRICTGLQAIRDSDHSCRYLLQYPHDKIVQSLNLFVTAVKINLQTGPTLDCQGRLLDLQCRDDSDAHRYRLNVTYRKAFKLVW
jgi:hypothetical protein